MRTAFTFLVAAMIAAAVAVAVPASAEPTRDVSILVPSDAMREDEFGSAVAISDDGTIVVGARSSGGDRQGGVYVLKPDGEGGYIETKLTASASDRDDQLGWSVAINSDGTVVAGAIERFSGPGFVSVFTPSDDGTYSEATLRASDGGLNDSFGSNVAIADDGSVAVGAPSNNAVYLFTPADGGYDESKLTSPGVSGLGSSVAIGPNGMVVAGAPNTVVNGTVLSGAVLVFTPTGDRVFKVTTLEHLEAASTPQGANGVRGVGLGASVSVGPDGTIVAGAPGFGFADAGGVARYGALFTFTPDGEGGYVELLVEQPSEAFVREFGTSVAIDDSGTIVASGDGSQVFVFTPLPGGAGYDTSALRSGDSAVGLPSPVAIGAGGTILNGEPQAVIDGVWSGGVRVFGPPVVSPPLQGEIALTEVVTRPSGEAKQFGIAVAQNTDGTTVVGALGGGAEGDRPGLAEVFAADGSRTATLRASDEQPYFKFGLAVDISDAGAIAVGAPDRPGERTETGAVYLFTPDGQDGFSEQILVPSPDAEVGEFGQAVAFGTDGSLIVGAPGALAGGSVYVYNSGNGGSYEDPTIIAASDAAQFDRLGVSVAAGPDGAIVAGADIFATSDGGAVYLFTPDGGGGYVETRLTPTDLANADRFGFSVDIAPDGTIVAGAPGTDGAMVFERGAAYVFSPIGPAEFSETKLLASDGGEIDWFGFDVAISNDGEVLVGAIFQDDPDLGAAYLYTPDGADGYDERKLIPQGGQTFTEFGSDVAFGVAGTILVGAPGGGINDQLAGSLHAFGAVLCNGLEVTVDLAQGDLPTDGDDVILGTFRDDVIAAGAGDDHICGGGGDDRIWGQAGNDVILGGDGDDRLRGGSGDDLLRGGAGSDDLAGGTGDDAVHGDGGDDTALRGGTGDDTITGGLGDDLLLSGNGGRDVIYGDAGADRLVGGPRPDELFGGSGVDRLEGGKGADALFGQADNDDLRGGPQPDVLDGGFGEDSCNGGTTGGLAPEGDTAIDCEEVTRVP